MSLRYAELTDRTVLALHGQEARTWLQGLVTNHVAELAPGAIVHTALLTPQGRLLADFFVLGASDGLRIDVETGLADLVETRLSLYRLRAAIRFARTPDRVLTAFGGPDAPPPFLIDPRQPELGFRAYLGEGDAALPLTATLRDYRDFRRGLGIAETAADGLGDKVYPVEANFDLLHGIDFSKGCFVGQETTSRMKRRGTVKSRILPFQCQAEPDAEDREVLWGEVRVGEVLVCEGGRGLALMRLDRLQEAQAAAADLTLAGQAVVVSRPDWLAVSMPNLPGLRQ